MIRQAEKIRETYTPTEMDGLLKKLYGVRHDSYNFLDRDLQRVI